jgi:hypothetical protein
MKHHRAARPDRCATPGSVHSLTDCQYCTDSSSCYLNVNGSTPVFGLIILLCATSTEFQAKIL